MLGGKVALLTAALVMGVGVSLAPSAPADQVEVNERVKDSLVWIETEYGATVRVPAEWAPGGEAMAVPVKIYGTCTGFVVDPVGLIATAAHCVDPDFRVFSRLRAKVISGWDLSSDEFDAMVLTANNERWPIEAELEGEPVDRVVSVIQPQDPQRVIDSWTVVQVVDTQKFLDGDNALLRVSGMGPMPPLAISKESPRVGQDVTCVGFPGSVRDVVDPNRVQQPSFKTGTVSSVQMTPRGAPTTEINADMSGGMSGGPTVDADGDVLGVNSYSPSREEQPFNFITDTLTLRTFLQQNGVNLAEPATPSQAALPNSFPWVSVVLGVIAAVAVAVAVTLAVVGGRRGLFDDDDPVKGRATPRKRSSPRRKRAAKKAPEVVAAAQEPTSPAKPAAAPSAGKVERKAAPSEASPADESKPAG